MTKNPNSIVGKEHSLHNDHNHNHNNDHHYLDAALNNNRLQNNINSNNNNNNNNINHYNDAVDNLRIAHHYHGNENNENDSYCNEVTELLESNRRPADLSYDVGTNRNLLRKDVKSSGRSMSSDQRRLPSPLEQEQQQQRDALLHRKSPQANNDLATAAATTTFTSASSPRLRECGGSEGGGGSGPGGGGGAKEHYKHSHDDNNSDEETDVIGDLVGHFGKWQLLMTVLLSLFQVPNTFHIISSVYQSANKEFWCKRPEHLSNLTVKVWRNISDSSDNCHQSDIDWSSVMSPGSNTPNQALIAGQHEKTPATIPCTAWEYNSNDNVGRTWASEWDLVCDKEYLLNVAEMVFLVGVATGGIVSGYLSDKFGRKKMLFITAVLQTIFGLALYFIKSFEVYITFRCLLGLASVAVTYSGLILAIEYVDGKWRTLAGMYNLFPLPISYMIISGIAYLTQDHQKLQLCIGIPGVFLCLLWFVVPESPRWLLVKGRIPEVKRILESVARFNGTTLPPNYETQLKPPPQETSSQSFLSLFRSRYLRCITICFLCIWFTMNLVYYGIILNMSSFGGNVYLNSALAGLVEIFAIAIAMYIITKTGKKWLFCATFVFGGIACCCAAVTEGQDDILWLKITFLMIGKFTISAGNTIMPVYTAELYPTAIRNAGVGACNVAAGAALILTPYLSLLNKIEQHLMMAIIAMWSIFGGIVVLFLPKSMADHEMQQAKKQNSTREHQ